MAAIRLVGDRTLRRKAADETPKPQRNFRRTILRGPEVRSRFGIVISRAIARAYSLSLAKCARNYLFRGKLSSSLPAGRRLIDEQATIADPSSPSADGSGILVFARAFRATGCTGRSHSARDLRHCGDSRDNHADLGASGVPALRALCGRGPYSCGVGGSLFTAADRRFCLAAGVRFAPRHGRVLSLLFEPLASLAAGRRATVLHLPAFDPALRRVAALFWTADVCGAGGRPL